MLQLCTFGKDMLPTLGSEETRGLQMNGHTASLAANLYFQNGKTMGEVTGASSGVRTRQISEPRSRERIVMSGRGVKGREGNMHEKLKHYALVICLFVVWGRSDRRFVTDGCQWWRFPLARSKN